MRDMQVGFKMTANASIQRSRLMKNTRHSKTNRTTSGMSCPVTASRDANRIVARNSRVVMEAWGGL